ncbi:MAG: helicase-exonuclease AddAB subunit AddA, partial [Epulopiscium sp.]|nr:helicase-exonuclease AddAB subunit AddA [Candidatus Epulonipiscium sp.]
KYQEGSDTVQREIAEKISRFLESFYEFREIATNYSIRELLWILYQQTGYFDYVGITSGGMVRQGNLRFLIEKAEQYENTSMKGLFHFVKYIENIKKAEEEEGSAKLLSESENLVRIMTIHKSKGLEFPVVFVADLGKEFNMTDSYSQVILHQKQGIGINYADIEGRVRYPSLVKAAIAETIRLETLSEELRVLYVALTRAKEKLILTGCVNDLEKKLSSWTAAAETQSPHIPAYYRKKAKSYLDWIMPALLRHPHMKYLWEDRTPVILDDNSQWKFTLYHKEDIYHEVSQKEENILFAKDIFSKWDADRDYSGKREEIFSYLQWEYPYKNATLLPSKLSISEIKRRNIVTQEEQNFYEDTRKLKFKEFNDFSKNKNISGAMFGTAMHTFMEYADFSKQYQEDTLEQQIQDLLHRKILSLEEANMLNRRALLHFFASPLAQRMRSAKIIEKEHPFSILLQPKDIFSQKEYEDLEEDILVNGIIDCFFYEDNDIVLVDYKSDKVSEEILKEKYELQLSVYRQALERTTGQKVKECCIYSFYLGKEVPLPGRKL